MKCNHKTLKCSSRKGDEIFFICPKCDSSLVRKITKKERALINRYDKSRLEVHKISHDFQKKFKKHDESTGRCGFKWKGWQLMEKVRKWAKKYPSVMIVRCDDDYFAGSDLVLIPHENDYSYMGTSVNYIPQCTGEEAITFFLYPHHRHGLAGALAVLKKLETKKRKKGSDWANIRYGTK
jgi:hypothetical protein